MAEKNEDVSEFTTHDVDALGSDIVTPAIAGLAVALIKPDLLPGMALGVATALGPKLMPTLAGILRPLVRTAIQAGYATASKAKEVAAEATEQWQDIVAEARAGQEDRGTEGTVRRSTRASAARRRA